MNSLYMTQDEQKQTAFRQEALYSLLEPTAIVISSWHLVLLQVSGYPLTFPIYLSSGSWPAHLYSLTLSYSFILLLSGYWKKPMQWLHWDPSAPVTLVTMHTLISVVIPIPVIKQMEMYSFNSVCLIWLFCMHNYIISTYRHPDISLRYRNQVVKRVDMPCKLQRRQLFWDKFSGGSR